jgi:hypothetical protein
MWVANPQAQLVVGFLPPGQRGHLEPRTQPRRYAAASGGVEERSRRRPTAVVVGGAVSSRRGSAEAAFPRRGGLVLPPGVVGRGGRPRRGGADRLPPTLRVRQWRCIRRRLPCLPSGNRLLHLFAVLML